MDLQKLQAAWEVWKHQKSRFLLCFVGYKVYARYSLKWPGLIYWVEAYSLFQLFILASSTINKLCYRLSYLLIQVFKKNKIFMFWLLYKSCLQVGNPLEEDLSSWGHHFFPTSVPDAILQASAGDEVWHSILTHLHSQHSFFFFIIFFRIMIKFNIQILFNAWFAKSMCAPFSS